MKWAIIAFPSLHGCRDKRGRTEKSGVARPSGYVQARESKGQACLGWLFFGSFFGHAKKELITGWIQCPTVR
ncbi:MAG: hypothetical protein ACE5DY_03165 [Mariprofundaceae bacterium]